MPAEVAIAVHTQDDEVCHPAVPAHDLGDTIRLQSLVDAPEERRTTDFDTDTCRLPMV